MQSLVTIGIPVYNGEQYIQKAIDSVLTQSYTNFKLIISDNASNDSTEAICREFALNDSRVRYVRHKINKGTNFNFPFVLSEASSKYFVWLGADDYWEPTFLEKNIEILESDVNIIGSIGLVEFYGIENFHIKKNLMFKIKNKMKRGSNDEYEKYKHVRPASGIYEKKASTYLRFDQASFVYGLFRTEKLKNRMISVNQAGWDLILILNLLKDGNLHVINKVLLHRFVSGVHSNSGYINYYKKKIFPIRELIFPGSTLFTWCLKNIGIKFILKNLDWFVLLLVNGWITIMLELKKEKIN